MGMFDWVDFQAPCTKCGVVITKWQSKDGPCKLEKVRVQDVGHLYASCDTCGQWNQYEVVLDAPIPVVPYHLVAQHRGMEQETEDE